MLNFKKPKISDIDNIRPYFEYTRSNASENTIGTFLMWEDYLNIKYDIVEDTLIVCEDIDAIGKVFLVPIGKNVDMAILEIEKYALENNIKLVFIDVTENDMPILENRYVIEKIIMPDWVDYVYNSNDLINFSGRKYHGQKNHINYFKKTFSNYVFKEFEKADTEELKKFIYEFKEQNEAGSKFFEEELDKSILVIDNNDKLNFFGLILKVDNKIIGFSMGEVVKDTLFVHIEKANRKYRGAYPMLVNEFAKRFAPNTLYINREDSACDKGLKESKMQYHPCYLLNKYLVKVLDVKE